MPVFHDIKCHGCGHIIEDHCHEMNDDSPVTCPACGTSCGPQDRLFRGRGPEFNDRRLHQMQEDFIRGDKAFREV